MCPAISALRTSDAIVVQLGCGLDSRCLRVNAPATKWVDGDFQDVIANRRKYYTESPDYLMRDIDATNPNDLRALPNATCAIVLLEGVSMYFTNEQLQQMLLTLAEKYGEVHILLDIYTSFGAKASKYKHPVNDVGVSTLYGVDDMAQLLKGTGFSLVAEHSFTPDYLVNGLPGFDKWFFKLMFTGKLYGKIYRLYELKSE